MKTKTLSILFALVAILSMSVGVFATDFNETWDEETVLTVFSDMEIFFPDLFVDINSDFLWSDSDVAIIPTFGKSADLEAKAPSMAAFKTMKATADPCGDGLIKIEVEIEKDGSVPTTTPGYGAKNKTYLRDIRVYDGTTELDLAKCTSNGGDNCRSVRFNSKGLAKVTMYVYTNDVFTSSSAKNLTVEIDVSDSMTMLFKTTPDNMVSGNVAVTASDKDYCQATLQSYMISPKLPPVRAKYDQNTGEARFQATVANIKGVKNAKYNSYFVIPAEVIAQNNTTGKFVHIKDYTCKYTIYNNNNAAPRTDYCKYGEGIALGENALIRFDITIDHLPSSLILSYDKGNIPFAFRVGGMVNLIDTGVFQPVDFPCPEITRLSVMDPLKPFMTFYSIDRKLNDNPIEPSGAYGVYEGGLWGIYQKCGKYAYMAVRLRNDGLKDEVLDLTHTAVAINGGTPMTWHWVLSSVEPDGMLVELLAGEDVILIGRAKVTEIPSQLNADTAMTGAVNFTDYGFYITGKVYSDHNNTNCVAAPK